MNRFHETPGANTSAAVRQQRNRRADLALGPRGFACALDYFPTPPWATRALCEFLAGPSLGEPLHELSCWEPACGEGHMARPLAEYFGEVRATDVHRYGEHHAVCDFLTTGRTWERTDWIVTNPPFALAERFIQTALARSNRGVAMFVRSAFTESAGRFRLFDAMPPAFVLQFSERVVLLEQRLIRANAPDPFNAAAKASTATSYCWLIWHRANPLIPSATEPVEGAWSRDTRHRWIAPCRDRLERPGDYPLYPEHAALAAPANDGALL
jgi:hypothetical protein